MSTPTVRLDLDPCRPRAFNVSAQVCQHGHPRTIRVGSVFRFGRYWRNNYTYTRHTSRRRAVAQLVSEALPGKLAA